MSNVFGKPFLSSGQNTKSHDKFVNNRVLKSSPHIVTGDRSINRGQLKYIYYVPFCTSRFKKIFNMAVPVTLMTSLQAVRRRLEQTKINIIILIKI